MCIHILLIKRLTDWLINSNFIFILTYIFIIIFAPEIRQHGGEIDHIYLAYNRSGPWFRCTTSIIFYSERILESDANASRIKKRTDMTPIYSVNRHYCLAVAIDTMIKTMRLLRFFQKIIIIIYIKLYKIIIIIYIVEMNRKSKNAKKIGFFCHKIV